MRPPSDLYNNLCGIGRRHGLLVQVVLLEVMTIYVDRPGCVATIIGIRVGLDTRAAPQATAGFANREQGFIPLIVEQILYEDTHRHRS